MPDALHTVVIIGSGLVALCPILLAVRTLGGMRHKRLYPVLRIKRLNGAAESLIVKEIDRTGALWGARP